MDITKITKNLNIFVEKEAAKRGTETYRVLQKRTIAEIAARKPQTEENLLEIYGLGEKKVEKYGAKILKIVNGEGGAIEKGDGKPLTVGEFLGKTNQSLRELDARVKGEVIEVSVANSGNLYIDLKDGQSESVLTCFVSKYVYEISGVEVAEGMEIIADGYPSVYQRSGRFSLRTQALEVAGEGALKAAYEKLKKKLEDEGVFTEQRKQELPSLPQTIGVITSRTGAVIDDIRNNLGSYGFKVKLFDARVEGKRALHDLTAALEYFQKNSVDVIVIGRGGGSLEALQAFNSESLVREIAESSTPVVACIGHDKDVPLAASAADKAESTPTAAAITIRESWRQAEGWLTDQADRRLLAAYQRKVDTTMAQFRQDANSLRSYVKQITNYINTLESRFIRAIDLQIKRLNRTSTNIQQQFTRSMNEWNRIFKKRKAALITKAETIAEIFKRQLHRAKDMLGQYEKSLTTQDPRRLLARGYSIVSGKDGVIKSITDVKPEDKAEIRVQDGTITAEVNSSLADDES